MFSEIIKNIAPEVQGVFALVVGCILIFGTLGKLQILQSILNTVMILMGLILVIWGLHVTHGIQKTMDYFRKK